MTVQVIFRSRFPLEQVASPLPDPAVERCGRWAINEWQKLLDLPKVERVADPEDWHENASWLLAAASFGLPVIVYHANERLAHINCTDIDPTLPTIFFGNSVKNDPILGGLHAGEGSWMTRNRPAELEGITFLHPTPEQFRHGERYDQLTAFHKYAGRAVVPATFAPDSPEDGPDLVDVLASFAEKGVSAAMVKIMAQSKYDRPHRIALPATSGRDAIHGALVEALDYSLIHLEAQRHAFLAQEWVPMGCEYRIVVVDGKPVAGAGCIEAFSPPFNAKTFDPKVERKRNSGEIVEDPGLVADYKALAEAFARDAAVEGALTYTVDLAVDDQGRPLVIETNPGFHYGLYAMDVPTIVAAHVDAAEAAAQVPA